MNIDKSGAFWVLRRYGGIADGKTVLAKIGRIKVDTQPNEIPDELKEKLTPAEFKKLQEHLTKEGLGRMKKKAEGLAADMNDMTCAMEAGLLDEESVSTLAKACMALEKGVRRSMKAKPKDSKVALV